MKDNCGNNHGSYFRTAGNPPGKKEWCCAFHEQDKKPLMKWISVKDRLPEGQSVVLIYDDDEVWTQYERVEVATFYDSSPPKWYVYGKGDYGPTHWMPFPAPPKDDE